VGKGQKPLFIIVASSPNRANRVDHKLRRKIARGRNNRFSHLTATLFAPYFLTLFQDDLSASLVNGTIHAATSKKGGVGSVYNRIYLDFGDIPVNKLYHG
jgi:hypothetical protein